MLTYAKDFVLEIPPFTAQPDGDEVIIGNAETGVFLAIPAEAAELLQDLANGKSIGQASDLYQQKHGETPDLDDFLSLLEAKGLLEPRVTGTDSAVPEAARVPERRYHFSNFPRSVAQRLVSAPVLSASFVLIAVALCGIVLHPSVAPSPYDLFFPDRRALTWAIIVIFDLFSVFIHEFAHLVAARALGVNSRMGMSNRLWNLVAETDLTGLWAVPKRRRYLPMLAGMLVDAVSGSLLVFLLLAHNNHLFLLPAFLLRLIRALTFGYVMRIAWEFFLFVRTDVYFVIATFFNCKNLLADTQVFLHNQLSRVIRSITPIEQSAVPDAELKVIRAYSFIWIIGRIWALTTLIYVTIPVGISYVKDLNHVFRTGYSANPTNFVDAVIMAVVFLVPTTAGLFLWIRNLVSRRS